MQLLRMQVNLPLLKTTVSIYTLTKETECLLSIQVVHEHGTGKRRYFYLLALKLLNSYMILTTCGSQMDCQKLV